MCAFIFVSIQHLSDKWQIAILYRCIVMQISETKKLTSLRQTCFRGKFWRDNLSQNLMYQNPLASALKDVFSIVKFYYNSMNFFWGIYFI